MQISGIILAGGLGTRMGRKRKAFLDVGGHTVIERLLAVYRPLFPEIVISARESTDFERFGVPVATDRFEVRSSLTGIHAGVDGMTNSHGFISGCDTPFLQGGLVAALLECVTPEDDIVIPLKEDGFMEPLCAVYSKRCLPFIEAQLDTGDCKIIKFFDNVRVRQVPVARLRDHDPEFYSFSNMNTPDDLARAQALAAERGI